MKLINPEEHIEWIEDRTILLSVTGSYAYGTNTENSDKDFKGVCVPPIEYYLGLDSFNEYNTTGGKNFKNTKDDVDISILHVNKFVKDAMHGVPNNIELLFVRPEDYLKLTPLGQRLIDNRHLFLSKNLKKKFGGYAFSQIQKMKIRKNNGTGRQEIVEEHGYDTKFFMHAVRLLTSAIDVLRTANFTTYRPNREFLLECRNGKFTFDEAVEIIKDYDNELEIAYGTSELPKLPDYKKINNLLIEIYKEALELSVK
ncbi:nucleotidyltransferase domain-containing protein [Paenibacillus lautus]|uniref:nucleotidyltransferase domain-containing protein n=1 Tax=Paenibacillus lautus TaxID=1401 RepID=UPI003D2A95DA